MDTATEILPRFTSKAEFLKWEERQETRFEFDGEDVTEVNGGILNHILVLQNVTACLRDRLRGTPFMVLSQVKIETIPGYRYPDVSVGRRGVDQRKTVFPAPIIVFEILSPSTSRVDLGRKRTEYRGLDTIRRYVVLDSDQMSGRVFVDGAEVAFAGPNAAMELPEIGVTLPLLDCYEDVTFD